LLILALSRHPVRKGRKLLAINRRLSMHLQLSQ